MGYYISYDGAFTVTDPAGALRALINADGLIYRRVCGATNPALATEPPTDFLEALERTDLSGWEWDAAYADDGTALVSITGYEKSGREDEVIQAIGPFVQRTDGDLNVISCQGEDGGRWRWVFTGTSAVAQDATITYPDVPDPEPEKPAILTVGALRELLSDVDDATHVVVATNDWYDNVGHVEVPGPDGAYVAVTLYPATEFDTRQI